jgi:iron complex outermembrane receptor protein
VFGQLEWKITDTLRLLPGVRLNFDRKSVDYDSQTYGGPGDVDAAGQALQRTILSTQRYAAKVDDTDVSGQLTLSYQPIRQVNAYATYAKSYKSVGLNTAGVPNGADGEPALDLATVKPEDINHVEFGIKTQPYRRVTANLSIFQTEVRDYQAQVVNAVAANTLRGYLANADKARVRGVEFDTSAKLGESLSLYGAIMPRRASKAPAGRRRSTSPASGCRASRSGLAASAASTRWRAGCWVERAISSRPSTTASGPISRRAPRLRST